MSVLDPQVRQRLAAAMDRPSIAQVDALAPTVADLIAEAADEAVTHFLETDQWRRLITKAEQRGAAQVREAVAVPAYLMVPTDRIPSDGTTKNVGANHVEVEVVYDADLPTLGQHEARYGGHRITLREPDEQVLLHELLHVALAYCPGVRTEADPYGHEVISRVEVALWETGWRLAALDATSTGDQPS